MLSVLIECGEDAGPLGATLASLVPGAIEGLVREVVVLDRGMDAATRKVTDHAGCRLLPLSALGEAVAGAKGEWLLLLEPGARLGVEWVEAVSAHLADVAAGNSSRPAKFTTARRDRPTLLKRVLSRRTALAEGLLMTRHEAVSRTARANTLEELAKGLGPLLLDASIRPKPRA